MKKILVIGSTVVDVIINVDKLPTSKGDIHIKSQTASLGGCAYNVSDTIRNFDVPNILFSPIGEGIYGDFVTNALKKKGLKCPIPRVSKDNGCCYCFVEESGERTFVSYHGAEYLIYKKWLENVDMEEVSSIYICGLEIEEKTGEEIVEFLEEHTDKPIFFAPGPRINVIKEELLDRIYALNPIIHLNDDEITAYFEDNDVLSAMKKMYDLTKNTVIVTRSANGADWYDKDGLGHADAVKAKTVVDTIGAGDSHIGAIMACLYHGMSMKEAIETANKVSSAVVSVKGATLSKERFDEII